MTVQTSGGSFPLSQAEIETFRKQGFLGPFKAFDEQEMEEIRRTIVERVLPVPAAYSPYPTHCRHLDSETVHKLCSSPAVVDRMASLYGKDLILWASAFFDKPPAKPGKEEEYPWHQDHYNWRLEPMLNISAWLAITPATIQNGCVEVIPGSHKKMVPRIQDTSSEKSFRFAGGAADPRYFDANEAVPLELKPGEFFLFNEKTLHHSHPNRTDAVRIGLSIRVTTPIAHSSEDWPCMLLHGEDEMGFNTCVSPPTGEPDTRWRDSLVPADDFSFDRVIPGLGWHLPEHDGTNHFAWTGNTETWLDLLPETSGFNRVQCHVLHAVTPDALQDVEIQINQVPIAVEYRDNGGLPVLEGNVPEESRKPGQPVRVAIRIPNSARPCDVNNESSDNRLLGLGVSRIALVTS